MDQRIHLTVPDGLKLLLPAPSAHVTLGSLMCRVQQGSVLAPVEFITYTEDFVSVIDNVPPVSPHCYADDSC